MIRVSIRNARQTRRPGESMSANAKKSALGSTYHAKKVKKALTILVSHAILSDSFSSRGVLVREVNSLFNSRIEKERFRLQERSNWPVTPVPDLSRSQSRQCCGEIISGRSRE